MSEKNYYARKSIFIEIRLYLIFCSKNLTSYEKDLKELKLNIDKLSENNSHKRLIKIYEKILNKELFSLRGFKRN